MTPNPAEGAETARSVNDFGLQLYGKLAAKPGNLFFSPYSVAAALSMVQAGAGGATAAQIAKVLRSPAAPHRAMRELADSLKAADAGVTLSIANALWGQTGTPFGKDFLETVRRDHGGGLNTADFKKGAEKETDRINAWVSDRTRGKIPKLLEPRMLDENTRLVLTNAVYFKAAWRDQFTKSFTEPAPFYGDSGEAKVQLMTRTGRYGYFADPSLQALDMPYHGERLSLLVVLPRDRKGLAAFEKALSAAVLQDIAQKLREQKVEVLLPRFKLEGSFEVSDALKALGMPLAFDPFKADFKPLCPTCAPTEPLYISNAVHKAFVAVDEEGTEAAAATAIMMAPGSAPMRDEPPVVRADHPFFFAVRDRMTGVVLFAGRLTRPTP